MLDIRNEEIIRLRDARKLPWLRGRGGGQLDIGTLHRWSTRGVRGVVLQTLRVGATTYTSVERILDFLARLNGPAQSSQSMSAQRDREIAAADDRLDQAGIT